jgi:RNA polymerase sigma-70 factor (ECF subfamily)
VDDTGDSSTPERQPPVGSVAEVELLTRLRARDEAAFAELVDRWSRPMLKVARAYVSNDASAEDVVQDAWLAIIRGLPSFEGRSSLKTWAFRIVVNSAKTRAAREGRAVPMSSILREDEAEQPAVDPGRFRGPDDQYPGGWAPHGVPESWETDPETAVQSAEVRSVITRSLGQLPVRQRAVVVLRDVEGCPADEVCAILGISAAHQRVLLHRGRCRVRTELETYYRRERQ